MTWPTYDPSQLELPTLPWTNARRIEDFVPIPGEVLVPIPNPFPGLDLLGMTPTVPLLEIGRAHV